MSSAVSRASRLAFGVALLASGCGGGGGVEWHSLARGSTASENSGTTVELESDDGRVRRISTRAGEARLEVELGRADWKSETPGLWHARLGFRPFGSGGHGLRSGEERFVLAPPTTRVGALAEGSFALVLDELWLRLPAGREPGAHMLLSSRLRSADPGATGRLRGRHFSGEGFAVWPGAKVERSCDLAPGSALRFATVLDPLVLSAARVPPEVVFRVELDGATVFEHHEKDPRRASAVWHRVVLPEEGRRAARLTFSVEGTPAYASFLDPVIGPAEVGQRGARPWGASRPDVVVFLADTFRADNLELYGGKLGLTPNLDRFARGSLACARTWSVGTFTLSAHASLFTGLYPHQAGVLGEKHALPEELETLAEFLSARGYRTGAITDSGIVSQAFAMDQGFAFFDEGWRTLDETLAAARAFLDADDGRPAFLFVHSYRVHRPYRVSEETRREHGARLGIVSDFDALEEQLVQLARREGHRDVRRAQDFPKELIPTPEAQALIQELRAHYLGGVIDLDRGFESFRRDLETRGVLANGFLVFASDHGEAFGEHGELYHKDDVYEEQTRVPLFVAGHGLQPRVLRYAASLLDMAPTVADLAGFPPEPAWLGRSLLALAEERELFSFECSQDLENSTFAVLDGGRKVIGIEEPSAREAGRIFAAFDLTQDAEERDDLGTRAAWPAVELARSRATLERLFVPLAGVSAAQLDPEKQSELDGLGYGGESGPAPAESGKEEKATKAGEKTKTEEKAALEKEPKKP